MSLAQRVPARDGARLATFVYGSLSPEACPVLALHGNGGSHATFCRVIDRIVDAGLAVIAIDARAQGQSDRGVAPLTYEQMAEDALCVLDWLHVGQAHVVGHSDGGIEALLLARDYPDRIASIVAGGANLTPEGVMDEWNTADSVATAHAWADWASHEPHPNCVIDRSLLPSADDTLLDAELLELMLREPHIQAASLASISCPTCVLVGEHDCITREETEAIASAIPGARLITVPDMGHSLPRQAPDAVALQVLTNVLLATRGQ